MKAINKSAKKVMDKLTKNVSKSKSIVIDNTNGVFMPVHVEFIGEIKEGPLFSVAHYYKQNDDLIADPEMVFLKAADENYYPIYFKDFLNSKYSVIIKNNRIKSFYPKEQKYHAVFAGKWLKNIKNQQGL